MRFLPIEFGTAINKIAAFSKTSPTRVKMVAVCALASLVMFFSLPYYFSFPFSVVVLIIGCKGPIGRMDPKSPRKTPLKPLQPPGSPLPPGSPISPTSAPPPPHTYFPASLPSIASHESPPAGADSGSKRIGSPHPLEGAASTVLLPSISGDPVR